MRLVPKPGTLTTEPGRRAALEPPFDLAAAPAGVPGGGYFGGYHGGPYFGEPYWGGTAQAAAPAGVPGGGYWGGYFGPAYFGGPYWWGVPPAGPWIRRAVAAALAADPGVAAVVAAEVSPLFVSTPDAPPALTFRLASNVRQRNLAGPNGVSHARFVFTAVTRDPGDGEALAEAVRNLFDGFRGRLPVPGGGSVDVIEALEVDEDDAGDDAGDGSGRPFTPTAFEYLFRYREPKNPANQH